jgi:ribosomal protein S14
MKKIMVKDKKNRVLFSDFEKDRFITRTVTRNCNFLKLLRWNANFKIKSLPVNSSKTRMSNRCVLTVNKKRLNKLSHFSRFVFLEKIKAGHINNMRKSCW